MISFNIQFVGEHETIKWKEGKISSHVVDSLEIAILDKGMETGRPSAMIRVPLEDGTVAIVETSARIMVAIGRAIIGKYPDLLDND